MTRGLNAQSLLDVLRAAQELALARVRLSTQKTDDMLRSRAGLTGELTSEQAQLVGRVAWAIPRAAARVPWRATCLVQALAAERWLESRGIPSELKLGARKAGEALDAHAWLEAGGRVVVGGGTSDYRPFTPSRGA
jgi:hypothetical protein